MKSSDKCYGRIDYGLILLVVLSCQGHRQRWLSFNLVLMDRSDIASTVLVMITISPLCLLSLGSNPQYATKQRDRASADHSRGSDTCVA